MRVIFTITLRELKKSRKRTLMTVLTIILSVSMMTVVLCGAWSVLGFLQEKEKAYGGDYEYSISGLSCKQMEQLAGMENVADVSAIEFIGSSFYGEKGNKSLLAIAGVNDRFIQNFALEPYLLKGRYPVNENEIALSTDFLEANGLPLSVGDTLSLSIGKRIWDEIDAELYGLTNYMGELESFHAVCEKEYTIVGILSDMNDSGVARSFNAFTAIDSSEEEANLTAYVTCTKISKDIYEQAEQNAAALETEVLKYHSELLMYYGVTRGKGALKISLAITMVILLIMAASAAMISNILSISLQERLKALGMLSSVGATGRQKRASVAFEAFLLGAAGIPLGLMAGIGLTAGLLSIIRKCFQTMFTFGRVTLILRCHVLILLLCSGAAATALALACTSPGRIAGKVTVIDVLRQTSIYHLDKKIRNRNIVSLFFGVYGALASRNIRRNPKRFRAITGSVMAAVILGLSLYSFADFMIYQASMDIGEDGSCYYDVFLALPAKELPDVVSALAKNHISADISYFYERYMEADFAEEEINPGMSGYFFGGEKNTAEIYVIGLDEDHFISLCEENGIDAAKYHTTDSRGILFNNATGNYGRNPNKIITGAPFRLQDGTVLNLRYDETSVPAVTIMNVLEGDHAKIYSMAVRDRAVLVVPLSCFDSFMDEEDYVTVIMNTPLHKEAKECLSDMGYFQVIDIAAQTENSRQVFLLLKLAVCVFVTFMTAVISLNVCNTVSHTIYMRRNEFAILCSVGMSEKGLKKTLLIEAALYGIKALMIAEPVSLLIHFMMYRFISDAMNPFVFYVNWRAYGIATAAAATIIVAEMIFSMHGIKKLEIAQELKKDG